MRSQCKRNSVLEWKNVRQSTRRTKDKANRYMWVIYEVAYVFVDRVGLCTVGKSKESFEHE